ncbi:MAG: helix-turn-helix transcriptional regulator [Ruminococcaceae bacterium]|nr:helix-turn-helix transcriptional regulator [Oscillospiraceae bacterium]
MKISDINPHIRYARVHKSFFRAKKEVSKCYDCRIFFFDNITGTAVINEKSYDILNKSALYLPPESEYQFNVNLNENGNVIVMDFDLVNTFEYLRDSLKTATKNTFDKSVVPRYELPCELAVPVIRTIPQIQRTLMQCTENFVFKNQFYREKSSALLKLCLLEFVKLYEYGAQSKLCEDVFSYIQNNYSNAALTNKDIAEHLNYHPYHLSAIIKQETGKTLHQYLIYYRLQIAKNYLLTTDYDILDIAWKCGFSSATYFIELFRKNTGTTPKKYRSLQVHTEI